ncbi:MAG: hypothetical protein ACJ8AT_37800 [Hyalangium sp.]|uniref:hypothetical protein n=1 Tax=Hyalangium sp. TaxID=2028555 RepID=UPI0038999AFA
MTEASKSIVIICEGPADRRTACDLADRVLSASVDWMVPELLDSFRQWRGLQRSEPFLAWKQVHTRADEANIRINGFFKGEQGAQDAFVARRALTLLTVQGERGIDAVLLIRDSDGHAQERRKGLEQARADVNGLGPILIGVAHTKRECWALAGFAPANDQERERLEELRKELGFDPCTQAQELTAEHPGAKRDAKRVLSILTGDDLDRELTGWKEAPLQQLEERGEETGLVAFIQELRAKLVPLWTGRTGPES